MIVYTIGHSNYTMDEFVERLKVYEIDYVVDIRGTPYSKYNVQYNKDCIAGFLKPYGLGYIYMGREFAAQRTNKLLYTEEGYADFEKVKDDPDFLRGIERLRQGVKKGYRIVLMGAKQDPVECHRLILVGRVLVQYGFEIRHILHEGGWSLQKELEPRIVAYYYTPHIQMSLDAMTGDVMDMNQLLQESYRKANRDIGYRVERLK